MNRQANRATRRRMAILFRPNFLVPDDDLNSVHGYLAKLLFFTWILQEQSTLARPALTGGRAKAAGILKKVRAMVS